ncbi:MAG: hypothetical protein AAGD22_01805 [Verrucomicrobiota bacterium]
MKTFLSLAIAALTLTVFAATADAGYYKKTFCGYDSCGRPVYRTVYVKTYSDFCAPKYPTYHRTYRSPKIYYRSSNYHRSNYGYSYGYRPSYCR